MSAFWIAIPIFLIRYGLLGVLSKESLRRASYFAPLVGIEKVAYGVYQITTILTLICLFLLKVETQTEWFFIGLVILVVGIIIYTISIVNFAEPEESGVNVKGLYQVSRNPMYIGYFIYFLGSSIITCSWILFSILLIFQISAHWIILSEERWCLEHFGCEYRQLMNNVRRYI